MFGKKTAFGGKVVLFEFGCLFYFRYDKFWKNLESMCADAGVTLDPPNFILDYEVGAHSPIRKRFVKSSYLRS